MIPISLSHFVALLVATLVGAIVLASLVRTLHRQTLARRNRRQHTQCALCGAISLCPDSRSPSPCPNCGHSNEPSPPGSA